MMTIRPLQVEDIHDIAVAARRADVDEMLAGMGASVPMALSYGLQHSLRAWVIWHEGYPLAAVGDTLAAIGVGVPWMVTTNHIDKNPRGFLRASLAILRETMQRHNQLINYVDDRNVQAIRWLEWLGFTMDAPLPYGRHGLPFRKFSITRSV